MKNILPLVTLLLLSPVLNAQKGTGFMIINDSIYMQGHLLYMGHECTLHYFLNKYTQDHIVYSCDSVTGFEFTDSREVFLTREASTGLSSRKMFLKVIEQGELTLYSSPVKGRKFAIESDTIILLEKYTYREQLAHATPPGSNIHKASYNTRSLRSMVRRYNRGTVSNYPPVAAGPQPTHREADNPVPAPNTHKRPGYMVINDSIYMQGHLVYRGEECSLQYFYDEFSPHPTFYSCDSVTGFGFSGQEYRTREASTGLSSRKMFLGVIQEGELTLYSSPVRGRKFAIERDTLILLEKYTFNEQIAHTIPPGSSIREARYTSRSLGNMVKQYNRGNHVRNYSGLTAGPQLRINRMTISTHTQGGAELQVPSTFLSPGVFVRLPHSRPSIDLLINLAYEPARVDHVFSPPGPINITAVNLAQNFLALEFMPSYTPSMGWEFNPYFSAGISTRVAVQGSNHVQVLNSGSYSTVQNVLVHPALMGGLSFAQGFVSDDSLPIQIDVSWGYSQLWDVSNTQYRVRNFHVGVGLSFLLW